MSVKIPKVEIESQLAQCIGTEKYHRLSPLHGRLVCTDGVKLMAELCGAFWLIDAIASYRRKEEMQFWTLKVSNNTAVLSMREDSDRPELVHQEIEYTDFPLDEMKVWVQESGQYMVAMLPSEY